MSDATSISMHITSLRTSSAYQAAAQKISVASTADIESWARDSSTSDYAHLRLIIGVWERIAGVILPSKPDQDTVFPCAPVGMMWDKLRPAVDIIRTDLKQPYYASQFEELKDEYQVWGETPAGSRYSTIEKQAICALFG